MPRCIFFRLRFLLHARKFQGRGVGRLTVSTRCSRSCKYFNLVHILPVVDARPLSFLLRLDAGKPVNLPRFLTSRIVAIFSENLPFFACPESLIFPARSFIHRLTNDDSQSPLGLRCGNLFTFDFF